jgi:DNA-binding PadR family transcriptional regulator
MDILRCIKKGEDYPMAVYRKLQEVYFQYYGNKEIDDETVRLRFKWLLENNYLEESIEERANTKKPYRITEKGKELLAKNVIVDVQSGSVTAMVYTLRIPENPLHTRSPYSPHLSLETCDQTMFQVKNNEQFKVERGAIEYPLQPDEKTETTIRTEGKFAKLSIDKGTIKLDWPKIGFSPKDDTIKKQQK